MYKVYLEDDSFVIEFDNGRKAELRLRSWGMHDAIINYVPVTTDAFARFMYIIKYEPELAMEILNLAEIINSYHSLSRLITRVYRMIENNVPKKKIYRAIRSHVRRSISRKFKYMWYHLLQYMSPHVPTLNENVIRMREYLKESTRTFDILVPDEYGYFDKGYVNTISLPCLNALKLVLSTRPTIELVAVKHKYKSLAVLAKHECKVRPQEIVKCFTSAMRGREYINIKLDQEEKRVLMRALEILCKDYKRYLNDGLLDLVSSVQGVLTIHTI